MRKVVRIDEDLCDGCGICVPNCAEGAIRVIDGKARLLADSLCDGLGNCLGTCPRNAIAIEERPADEFDEVAVGVHLHAGAAPQAPPAPAPEAAPAKEELPCGCPGRMMRKLAPPAPPAGVQAHDRRDRGNPSQLRHWPVQLHLLPTRGEVWNNADVLIAADCVAFAMPDFHQRLLAGRTVAIGCPKLDDVDFYTRKLAEVFAANAIGSVTVAHMEVPCCMGIVAATRRALAQAGRADIQLHDVTVGLDGAVREET
jgi:NAD-dependent dihydropyrimidine dehydrogenase PreA subunit